MGKAPIPTIVGGGITLVPGVVGEFLFLTSLTPPEASTSARFRIVTAATPDQLVAESQAGQEDTTIGPGSQSSGIAAGLLRPDVVIGRNIQITHANSGANNAGIFIGASINSGIGSSTQNVVLAPQGVGAGVATLNSFNVLIGGGVTVQNNQSASTVVGGAATAFSNTSVTIVGAGANCTGNETTAIGQNASCGSAGNVTVGQNASTAAARCIAIGKNQETPNADMIKIGTGGQNGGTAGQIVIGNGVDFNAVSGNAICLGNEGAGGGGNFTTRLQLGQNQHPSGVAVPAYTVIWKSALGTDVAAGSVTFVAPKATGNAAAGSFLFQTSPAGASGATLQTATTRLTISPNGVTTLAAPTAAAETLVITGFGGAGQASIRLDGLTNGAGAAAGTLNNAPAAGDPAFWIPINVAGTVRFVPAW